jgi:hypothetical protein
MNHPSFAWTIRLRRETCAYHGKQQCTVDQFQDVNLATTGPPASEGPYGEAGQTIIAWKPRESPRPERPHGPGCLKDDSSIRVTAQTPGSHAEKRASWNSGQQNHICGPQLPYPARGERSCPPTRSSKQADKLLTTTLV